MAGGRASTAKRSDQRLRLTLAGLGGLLLPLASSVAIGWVWPASAGGAIGAAEANFDALAAAVLVAVPASLGGISIAILAASWQRALYWQVGVIILLGAAALLVGAISPAGVSAEASEAQRTRTTGAFGAHSAEPLGMRTLGMRTLGMRIGPSRTVFLPKWTPSHELAWRSAADSS